MSNGLKFVKPLMSNCPNTMTTSRPTNKLTPIYPFKLCGCIKINANLNLQVFLC